LLVNGRLSNRSFKFYKLFMGLFSAVIGKLDQIITQTDEDADKFIELGASPDKVVTYGNTKFDQVSIKNQKPAAKELKDYLGLTDQFVFIAGSVREGEIKDIVEAVGAALKKTGKLKAVIAPRHLKDLKALQIALQSAGLDFVNRTGLKAAATADVPILVLDSMGELGGLYDFADLAFVGGSLVGVGGHDPLEPASARCAVCFGPHMDNCRLFADILVDSGGARYVKDGAELSDLISKLASDRSLAEELGEKARQAVLSHSGVSQRIALKLLEFI
jgi:3-deoxy-D-manno-octulosonic-acid transferase